MECVLLFSSCPGEKTSSVEVKYMDSSAKLPRLTPQLPLGKSLSFSVPRL